MTIRIVQVCLPNPRLTHLYQRSCSALEEIEKQLQALLAKGTAARSMDKDEDSKEVAGLIEQLREAIGCYQVSVYQIIALNAADVGESLGARGHLPSGYIVSSLWVLKQFAQSLPSGYFLNEHSKFFQKVPTG